MNKQKVREFLKEYSELCDKHDMEVDFTVDDGVFLSYQVSNGILSLLYKSEGMDYDEIVKEELV